MTWELVLRAITYLMVGVVPIVLAGMLLARLLFGGSDTPTPTPRKEGGR